MTPWLRVLIALAEDPGLAPNTDMVPAQLSVTSGNPMPSLDLHRYHTQTWGQNTKFLNLLTLIRKKNLLYQFTFIQKALKFDTYQKLHLTVSTT